MNRGILGALACLALVGCGSSSTKTVTVTSSTLTASSSSATSSTSSISSASPGTRSSQTASSTTAAGPVLHLSIFRSPTGNIGCELVAGFARCDIANRSWTPPPRPASCPLDYGQGLEVGKSGPGHLVCAGDTALSPQAAPLAYSSSSVVGPIVCVSAPTGMTCTNRSTGHGFFLAAQSYRTF